MVIEVPEELKDFGEAIRDLVVAVEGAAKAGAGGKAVDYARVERELAARTAAVERAAHGGILRRLEVDRERVMIAGAPYTRVGHSDATYYTLAGPVVVAGRALYRRDGERNGKVVDAVSLRTGALEGGWLPQTARAMAHMVQQGTSREAEQTAAQMGRLPYSRCSFERVAHLVGELYVGAHADIEDGLMAAYEVPRAVRSVSVSLDRVAVPMEEPRPRPPGRPRKGAPKRPVTRAFRMAYCATVTLHDGEGTALHTVRYGRMPKGDIDSLCDALAGDVVTLLGKRRDLDVVLLTDGAPELRDRLAQHLSQDRIGVEARQLVDFWHVVEKLGRAAQVIHGPTGAQPVVQRWKLLLCNSTRAVPRILRELTASGKRDVRVGDACPVHDAITYLENQRDRMGYVVARLLGLPIGSGNVEATCKSLVGVRMKRAGSRWKEPTGEHIIQLRALALSDRWDHAIDLTLRPLRRAVRAA
jgi:hypothetical protein